MGGSDAPQHGWWGTRWRHDGALRRTVWLVVGVGLLLAGGAVGLVTSGWLGTTVQVALAIVGGLIVGWQLSGRRSKPPVKPAP